ncbi:MAG TPA: CoA-binding protein [Spirochaetota bacterium]|nr:CoA-binding protein [Spirochaetota bacterium]HPQ53596.1 CoA-binding protein [Spirochaetota bacterium]
MNLKKIFDPKSVAVVGVSLTNPFNPANIIYHKNNLRYKARTYCVNPGGGTLYGDTVYKAVGDIPEKVDLVVLSIRAELVPAVMEECIAAGAGGAIIISGGFAESGRSDLQERVREISRANKFPVIGPNCLGIFSPPGVDTFFLPHERLIDLREGSVALVSQSGGILVDQTIKLTQEGVGISRAVSIGNKAVIDEVDMLEFFLKDRKTNVVGLYIEGFSEGRGRDFISLMKNAKKPVVVLKSGKTPGGSRAVSSHTASIAGDYKVFSEVLRAGSAIEARNEMEFVSYCEVFSCCSRKKVKNVCIITASGGHGAIAADGCFHGGLAVTEVPDEDAALLRPMLSKSVQGICSLGNPVDLTGSAGDFDFQTAVKFFLEKHYVDCILLLLLPYLPGITSDIGARIAQLARESGKPVITYMPHIDKYGIFIDGFESNGVPVAHSVEGAVYMALGLARRGK